MLGRPVLTVMLALVCAAQPTSRPVGATLITTILGAKLIDGTGGAAVENTAVIVENGRIRWAGPRANASIPADSIVVDASGRTLIPGLIDVHCHYLGTPEDVKKYLFVQLRWGVTTTRSAGGDPPALVALMHDARYGKFLGPRVYTSGLGFTHPKGTPLAADRTIPQPYRPASPGEARKAVRTLAAEKVDFIKIWIEDRGGTLPAITPEIRAVITDEARKHAIPVVAHVTKVADIRQIAELGVTDLMHTPEDSVATAELIRYARSKRLSFAPALAHKESSWRYYETPTLLEDPKLQGAFYPVTLARLMDLELRAKALAAPDLAPRKAHLEEAYRFVKAMSDAGVPVITGSDTGGPRALLAFGGATHREIEMLVEAGLTPATAIRAATLDAAKILTRTPDPEYGTIQAGKAADIVLLDGDPTADIRNLARIHKVMRAGQWVR